MRISDFQGRTPELKLEEFFAGPLDAWGFFEDRSGTIKRQFQMRVEGEWDGRTLTLSEKFTFDDGERNERQWKLTQVSPGQFEGREADVRGIARGRVAGNAFHWTYRLGLKVGGRMIDFDFDDWMFQQDDRTLVNRATVRKFGIRVAGVTVFFRKAALQDRAPVQVAAQ